MLLKKRLNKCVLMFKCFKFLFNSYVLFSNVIYILVIIGLVLFWDVFNWYDFLVKWVFIDVKLGCICLIWVLVL